MYQIEIPNKQEMALAGWGLANTIWQLVKSVIDILASAGLVSSRNVLIFDTAVEFLRLTFSYKFLVLTEFITGTHTLQDATRR